MMNNHIRELAEQAADYYKTQHKNIGEVNKMTNEVPTIDEQITHVTQAQERMEKNTKTLLEKPEVKMLLMKMALEAQLWEKDAEIERLRTVIRINARHWAPHLTSEELGKEVERVIAGGATNGN